MTTLQTAVTPERQARRRALKLFSVTCPTAGTCRPAGLDSVRPDPNVFIGIDYANPRSGDDTGYVIGRREADGEVTVLKGGVVKAGTGYVIG